MKVYQLRIESLDMVLEPVFKSRVAASRYKEKYKGRKLLIEETELETSSERVYRLSLNESDGYDLLDKIFISSEAALKYVENESLTDYQIHEENIISDSNLSYQI